MNYKKIIMLILVCFGPLGIFYFLSTGQYYFKKLPLLHDSKNGKPDSYSSFTLIDQEGKTITSDSLKNKLVVVNYMDKECPYGDCKVDAKMLKLIVYNEIVGAAGFKDVVIITEVNDSIPANRKRIEESLEVDGARWKFVYSKNFTFFDVEINKSNPFKKVDKKYVNGKVFERSVLLLDKQLRIRAFLDNSADIEFKRLNEELRLLKKEYSKKKTVI